MTLRVDIEMNQGDAALIPLTVWADAAKTTPKNIGGGKIDYRIGKINMDQLILRVTEVPNANGSVTSLTDPQNGIGLINLKQQDTAALPARRYAHQVIVTDSAGKPNVVTNGYITIKETLPDA